MNNKRKTKKTAMPCDGEHLTKGDEIKIKIKIEDGRLACPGKICLTKRKKKGLIQ